MQSIARISRLRPARLMQVQRRGNSTQVPGQGKKEVSPHIGFYKTFSRPIAKVLLLATFTYQVAYWGWVKLEKDEIKAQRSAEIEGLEAELKGLTEGREKTKTMKP